MENRYIAKALIVDKYHIFETDNRSLCGRRLIINPNPSYCVEATGKEVFNPTEDCKTCFKKLGVIK